MTGGQLRPVEKKAVTYPDLAGPMVNRQCPFHLAFSLCLQQGSGISCNLLFADLI